MKPAAVLVLLVSSVAASLAAEASAPNATVTPPSLYQATPSCPASAASSLRVPETLSHMPPKSATGCRDFRTVINYWGFQGVSGDYSCPVMCGVCYCSQMTNRLVGQVIYECDGSITSWGLDCSQSTICSEDTTITEESCPPCGM